MDVIALISGGKDSCFSILKARQHGHRIIVLAHICPPCEEADSLMYQSVGSVAVPMLAEAMNLPLIIRQTQAKAKKTTLNYAATDGDEVEDLVALLRDVRDRFPGVQAVCSGALWSDYQRLRVENASSRVGLMSIAPLWRREQSDLLDEMIEIGVDAVLIKVAGVGLNETHLGKSLYEMRPLLQKLERMYGSHICGEGGEYETLVRWMPGFEKRLILEETEVVIHSNDIVAPVSFLRLNKLNFQEAGLKQNGDLINPSKGASPSLLFQFEPKFYDSEEDHIDSEFEWSSVPGAEQESFGSSSDFLYLTLHSKKKGREGVQDLCHRLKKCLLNFGEALGGIVTVLLHLQQVHGSSYAEANKAYNETFGSDDIIVPPARACVEVPRGNCGTTLETLVRRGKRENAFALHVQSLSEWAPPCIGPYAQFVEEDNLIYISGVLPLHAPTASVAKGMPAGRQVEVCLENLRRTLEAGHGTMENIGLLVAYTTIPSVVKEVTDILFNLLENKQSIKVILPVSQLPKGALVEIRAVGVLQYGQLISSDSDDGRNSQHMAERILGIGLAYKCVKCGFFTFVVVTCQTDDGKVGCNLKTLTGQISNTMQSAEDPLAIQWYGLRIIDEKDVNQLTALFPNTAVSVFSSSWMPNDARWICIITMVAQHQVLSADAPNELPS